MLLSAYLWPNQKYRVKFNCFQKHISTSQQGTGMVSKNTCLTLNYFNREQFSTSSSTSKIFLISWVLSQIHTHAPLLNSTASLQKCKGKAHPATVSIQNAFCNPNVGENIEEIGSPNKDVQLEVTFEKHWAFCGIHQHLQRAPLCWKPRHLSKASFRYAWTRS